MKNFFIYIGFVCWIVAGNFVLAQPGEVETKKVKGKECYVHIVEAGQTLYSISRIYNSDVDKIKTVNEGVDEALDIGQIVYVPITKKSPRFIEHKVQRKETVYGISKEYGVTPEQLSEANPELKDGLKKGDIIQIPVHLSSLEKYKKHSEDAKNDQNKDKQKEYNKFITEADQKFKERKYEAAANAYEQASAIKPNEIYPKNKIAEIMQMLSPESVQKEPVGETPPEHPRVIDDSTFYHIVQPKETMYAISKRFMVDQKIIKKMNNGLPDGLRAGDTLILPRTGIEDKVVLVKDPNQAVASMDTLPIPTLLKKDSYNVVFLLPFYIDKNNGAFTSPKGSDAIYTRTKWATEFYMGALIAIDSLEKAGAHFKIHTLDTKGDTSVLKTLLTKKEVKEADLIIGPFFGSEVKVATQWAKNNQTPIVVPFATSNRILLDNPYVMKMSPSKSAIIDASVNYVLEKYRNADLFLIKSTESKDKYAYERFQSKFDENKLNYKENHEILLREISLGSSSGRDINNVTTGGKVSVFIVPSSEMSMASKTLTRLNKVSNERKHNDSKFIVVGMDNWIKFDQIDFEYQNKLNLHIPSPSYTNYNNDEEVEITKKFRKSYNYDPSEFALQGFDVAFYSLGGLYLAGKNFMFYHKNLNIPTVKNNFVFEQVSEGCGFENQHVYMLRIKDYELVDAQKHIPLYVEQEED